MLGIQEFAVLEFVRSFLRGCPDCVGFQKLPDGHGRGLGRKEPAFSGPALAACRDCGRQIQLQP